MEQPWFWEGNVVKSVVAHIEREGWTVESIANTETREQGVDISATRNGKTLLIEAKGYPLMVYARGTNQGQPKKTAPATQARHWYGEVFMAAVLRQAEFPDASVAIALPDFPVFTNLISRTGNALRKLDIAVYLLRESGVVEVLSR